MKNKELRLKKVEKLYIELFNLLHQQFNLRMKSVNNQLRQVHLLKQVRRDIARIKTILTEKKMYNE